MVDKQLKRLLGELKLICAFDLSYTVIVCLTRCPICIYREIQNEN
jgi:hypothetical protein